MSKATAAAAGIVDESQFRECESFVDEPLVAASAPAMSDPAVYGFGAPRHSGGEWMAQANAIAAPCRFCDREVDYGPKIGEGSFGVVYEAVVGNDARVAVKFLKGGSTEAFRIEVERHLSLQHHRNVVQCLGTVNCVIDGSTRLGLVLEFCRYGALSNALYGPKPMQWSRVQRMRVAREVAAGLAHLHKLGIVHRDVAARNVLLSEPTREAKVSDFGIAREVADPEATGETKGDAAAPVKWMAPEQMERNCFSHKSDVFAFGVLLFEIFAAAAPWAELTNMKVVQLVLNGERLVLPDDTPAVVSKVAAECWRAAASERPTMADVGFSLGSESEESEDEE